MDEPIDLRSDTVTRPCAAMRQAIAAAEVGDDAICVDPTVRRLEETTAELLGMESALFVPSGTMANQIAIRGLCTPGDEFVCESACHIYNYQQGAFAQLSGVVARTIEGDDGVLRAAALRNTIRPNSEHMVRTRLLCLENTHNRASGRVQPLSVVEEVSAWARTEGLFCHLDGARLFNAVVATGTPADEWCRHFDTATVCFSKGLGAPVGSAVAGTKAFIAEARRHRKLFGGTMRQAGIIAAGALFALENNIDRLADDHLNAQAVAAAVRDTVGLSLVHSHVDTNIVIFSVEQLGFTAVEFASRLREQGVLLSVVGPSAVRAVTHLDVSESQVAAAIDTIQGAASAVC